MSDRVKDPHETTNDSNTATQGNEQSQEQSNANIKFEAPNDAATTNHVEATGATETTDQASESMPEMPEGFPELDEEMLGQMQEMMAKINRADELEEENSALKSKLGRLAADFESYRQRTSAETKEAEAKGISKAAETLMPIYDDLGRAVSMGTAEPDKLLGGMQNVQSKLLSLFAQLGLETTGKEGDNFDPQWHEAIQVIDGEEDDVIAQVYELGFRMGERCVRPARVVVSRKG